MLSRALIATVLTYALPGMAAPASAPAPAPACQSTVSGDLRLHTLQSKTFSNQRTIRVLLPEGYHEPANSKRRYPVLYMLDGQNLFDACLSDVSHHEWGLDEIALRLAREGKIPPMIIVGVDHAGLRRAHEYLPYRDYMDDSSSDDPAGKRFPAFLVNEVMLYVNTRYRTLSGPQNTGLGGSSYGGVATLYALMARPGHFGYGLIESPSLHIGMGQLVRDTDPLVAMPVKVFLGFGGQEAGDPAINARLVAFVRKVEANFRAAGYDESNLRFVLDPEAEHTEAAWEQRLPEALTFLFGGWQPPGGQPAEQ